MSEERVLGRIGAIILILAIFVAPFIALVFRTEAGLVMMAVALSGGSFLLSNASEATPVTIHRWLRLGIFVNLILAVACVGVAAWLLWRH
jgi:hypothetical protein